MTIIKEIKDSGLRKLLKLADKLKRCCDDEYYRHRIKGEVFDE